MKELTNSGKGRNEKMYFLVVGRPKKQWRDDGLIDVFSEFCCYKQYHHAKKWIEKNQTDCTTYFIVEQVVWIASKNLNYIQGKRKNYWDN